jgi:putative sterol carrier protein
MKIFSEEWANQLKEKINNNQEFKNSAEEWDSTLVFKMTTINLSQSVRLEFFQGVCQKANLATESDFDKAEYIIESDEDSWKKIFSQNLAPMQALLTKKMLITKGSTSELLPYVNALKEILNCAKDIKAQ